MSSICDDLRAAILQAAMQGKLTEQLPEDGNAEELLVEIKAKKEELITDGKIKKQKEVVAAINEPLLKVRTKTDHKVWSEVRCCR